jgi:hypothetical protein
MDLPDGWFTKDGNSDCSEHWPMVSIAAIASCSACVTHKP